jgi:MFS family permease
VPLYLSELAPARWRGALNMLFQLATTTGNLTANLINYGTGKLIPWGWRLSLGLAGVPACLLILGSIVCPETPNSLIERGHFEKGRATLEKVRGIPNVDLEYDDILEASRAANQVKHPFKNILQRENRPQLAMAVFCPFFQEFTGINNILFYAPVLFQTIGFGADASLYSAVITGACLWGFTFVTILTVDRWGRRKLLLTGGLLMFISQVISRSNSACGLPTPEDLFIFFLSPHFFSIMCAIMSVNLNENSVFVLRVNFCCIKVNNS